MPGQGRHRCPGRAGVPGNRCRHRGETMITHVMALPGGVMPASMRYAPLSSALSSDVQLHLKDLEVYAAAEPPAGYSIDLEVRAVAALADSLGLEQFHLLGYSGGGFVSL